MPRSTAKPESAGPLCPACAIPMGVVKTRHKVARTERVRQCSCCGKRVKTVETAVAAPSVNHA